MQHRGLTQIDTAGNTFLTINFELTGKYTRPVRLLLWIVEKLNFVAKESTVMRYRGPTNVKIISSQTMASLTADTEGFSTFNEPASLISRTVLEGIVRVFEASAILILGIALWAFYVADFTAPSVLRFLPIAGFVGVLLPLLMQANGLFKVQSFLRLMKTIPSLIFIWAIVFSSVFAVVFFTKIGADYSRIWLGGWAIGGLAIILASRTGLYLFLNNASHAGQMDQRAVLVGGGAPALNLIQAFEAAPASDVSIIGVFDDRSDDRSPAQIGNLRKLGTVKELVEFARQTRVDVLIVTLPLIAETRLLEILKQLWVLPVDIRLSAYSQKLRYKSRAYSYIGNIPLLDVFDKPLSGWNAVLKNIEDKVLAALGLIVLSPVMALVALAVRLDSPGPAIFRQKRYGFNNELIEVFKFRSMYIEQSDAKASKLVTRNDPRVTRVGRFIRKTSLDELPQFINVLRGDLSLVGPRPHATHAKAKDNLYTDVVDGYFARHRVKPGITGWAQINGWRGETDTEDKIQRRVEHDLFYIENWSLLFDLYILAKTPFSLIETDQAY